MTSLSEILKQKNIKSRQTIMDTVINDVINSLKTEMNNVAEEGKGFGYININDFYEDLQKFDLRFFKYYQKYELKNGWWNWWGLRKKNKKQHIVEWIFYEIEKKDIFKGIEMCFDRSFSYIVFKF